MFFTARIERPPLYRGGSASKKNGLPAPAHPSEAARWRAQKIIRGSNPLLCSGSTGPTWVSFQSIFIVGALRAQRPYQLPRHPLPRPRVARAGGRPGCLFHPRTGASQTTHPDVSCASCFLTDDFCEFESHCVTEECHESHSGLLWALSTVDG